MSAIPGLGRLFGQSQHDDAVAPFTTPTYQDVRAARSLLRALNLPTELVLSILDLAEYWPTHQFEANINGHISATARGGDSSGARLCLDASIFDNPTVNAIPSGVEKVKIKAIEFDMVSRDQGWTSENTRGTFSTSSWLEVSILRNMSGNTNNCRLPDEQISSPLAFQETIANQGWSLVRRPRDGEEDEDDLAWYLQGNRVTAAATNYRVVWYEDGFEGNEGAGQGEGFLQELKVGDTMLIWARAMVRNFFCGFSWLLANSIPVARMAVHRGAHEGHCCLPLLSHPRADGEDMTGRTMAWGLPAFCFGS